MPFRSAARARRAGALAVLALAALPAAAPAATVGVGVGADPLEDRAVTFTTTTDTTTNDDGKAVKVYAKWRVADGNACAPTYGADPGKDLFFGAAGNATKTVTFDDPGSFVVCSYLSELSGSEPVARGTTAFAVRANAPTVAVQAPALAQTDTQVPVTLAGRTEVGREVYARIKPAGAGPCAQSYQADPTSGWFALGIGIAGDFSVARLTDRVRDAGQYTVCAWVQERISDAQAEAVGTATVNVLPPRPAPSEIDLGLPSFRAVPFGGSITRSFRGGTSVSFSLNTPATARFTVQRRTTGRRSGGRCRKATRRLRRARTCTRYVTVRGSFTWQAASGSNSFRFSGRVGGRTLRRGSYRLVMTTRNVSGEGIVRRRAFRLT